MYMLRDADEITEKIWHSLRTVIRTVLDDSLSFEVTLHSHVRLPEKLQVLKSDFVYEM